MFRSYIGHSSLKAGIDTPELPAGHRPSALEVTRRPTDGRVQHPIQEQTAIRVHSRDFTTMSCRLGVQN